VTSTSFRIRWRFPPSLISLKEHWNEDLHIIEVPRLSIMMTTGQRQGTAIKWNVPLRWIPFETRQWQNRYLSYRTILQNQFLYFYLLQHRARESFNRIKKKEYQNCGKIVVLTRRTLEKCPQTSKQYRSFRRLENSFVSWVSLWNPVSSPKRAVRLIVTFRWFTPDPTAPREFSAKLSSGARTIAFIHASHVKVWHW